MPAENLHPTSSRLVSREDKENLLGQRGGVFWLFGLSGSGKSTLAIELERELLKRRFSSIVLDGDNLRSGLNNNLGFSDEDRTENIRRNGEVAKLFAEQGVITFVSLITPRRDLRALARETIGEDFVEIFVKADYGTCAARDPKGLYAKAEAGEIRQFTGKDSGFEEPGEEAELILDTDEHSAEECAHLLLAHLASRA